MAVNSVASKLNSRQPSHSLRNIQLIKWSPIISPSLSLEQLDSMFNSQNSCLFSTEVNSTGPSQKSDKNLAHLHAIREILVDQLPTMFIRPQEYGAYALDVIFENNYWNQSYKTVGIKSYVWEMAKIRIYGHFKFANIKTHLLRVTIHEGEKAIRIRWRITGVPQTRVFLQFYKFLPGSKYSRERDDESNWFDGVSTFFLNEKGDIQQHTVDRVERDTEGAKDGSVLNTLKKLASQSSVNPT
ncbi:unnamed protein product [Dimorphilus gyrociliatus]|uniref:Uncharacterized protein n=1 Tax=Dimorphilus gyrociliatus TaxID=2664684 RepID=A0A7I8W148_9ANNE|nr:unnamed protein product [Dimorphilus gyrociliatus]